MTESVPCPHEFTTILNRRGRKYSTGGARSGRCIENIVLFEGGLIQPRWISRLRRMLERQRSWSTSELRPPAPRRFSEAFSEELHRTGRFGSALPRSRGPVSIGLRRLGVWRMLQSASLRRFVECFAGERLIQNGCQVIRYDEGDYQGPHLDIYPPKHGKRYYFDFHLTLSNEKCVRQELFYQTDADGHCNRGLNVGSSGTIAIHRLPFWHQVTPLVGRGAKRWVLIASFDPASDD